MPPVTRTPITTTPPAYRLAPLATFTPNPIRASATRRATASASRSALRGVIVNPKEECCICFTSLDEKRSACLAPCRHRFHTTCINVWLETRSGRTAQTCPLCRTRVHGVETNGTSAPPLFPYGDSGEPTRAVLQRESQPDNLQWLLLQCDDRLLTCAQLEAAARLASRPNEYLLDIQNEARSQLARKEVLRGLLEEVERGEWRPQRLVESFEHASRRLQQLQQLLQQERFQFVAGNFARPTAASVAATRPLPPPPPARQPRMPVTPPRRLARSGQQQPHPQLLPRGTAAATQNRPATIPVPFHAGRATVASLARAASTARLPPPAAAPAPPRPVHRVQQHMQPGRVSAATAGPARRRLTATSGSPVAASPPMRHRRVTREQPADARGQEMQEARQVDAVNDEEQDEEVVNYHETPRRSERIARRRVESMNI